MARGPASNGSTVPRLIRLVSPARVPAIARRITSKRRFARNLVKVGCVIVKWRFLDGST